MNSLERLHECIHLASPFGRCLQHFRYVGRRQSIGFIHEGERNSLDGLFLGFSRVSFHHFPRVWQRIWSWNQIQKQFLIFYTSHNECLIKSGLCCPPEGPSRGGYNLQSWLTSQHDQLRLRQPRLRVSFSWVVHINSTYSATMNLYFPLVFSSETTINQQ